MLPVVLIHGYSSEGQTNDNAEIRRESVQKIYGRLVDDLEAMGVEVISINLARYLSLDDGITLEDLAWSMQRALLAHPAKPLDTGFNAIIHSTGALVSRNWIRRHTKPGHCALKRLIHLAGANHGSGWAHVGTSQVARFARLTQGTQRGLAVLKGLELGSGWAIDLHTFFVEPGQDMSCLRANETNGC